MAIVEQQLVVIVFFVAALGGAAWKAGLLFLCQRRRLWQWRSPVPGTSEQAEYVYQDILYWASGVTLAILVGSVKLRTRPCVSKHRFGCFPSETANFSDNSKTTRFGVFQASWSGLLQSPKLSKAWRNLPQLHQVPYLSMRNNQNCPWPLDKSLLWFRVSSGARGVGLPRHRVGYARFSGLWNGASNLDSALWQLACSLPSDLVTHRNIGLQL